MKTKFLRTGVDQEPQEFEFDQNTITLGRHSSSDLPIKDKKASRHHAKIEFQDGEFRASDLESNNGTLVNGEPIVSHILKEGDEISIGGTTLRVVLVDLPGKKEEANPALEKQMELKKKIDGVKSSIAADRERTVREKRRSPLIPIASVAVIAGIIIGVIMVRSSISGSENARKITAENEAQQKLEEIQHDLKRGNLNAEKVAKYAKLYGRHLKKGKTPDPFTAILDKIELAKQHLDEIKNDQSAYTLDIVEVREFAKKHGRYLKRNKEGHDPFTSIALKYEKKALRGIPEKEFKGQLASVETSATRSLRKKEYGEAILKIESLLTKANREQKKKILPILHETKNTIWKDFQHVIQEGSELEAQERYDEAKSLYRDQAPHFKGTEVYAILASRPGDLDLLVRARAAEMKTRESVKKRETEIASRPEKREETPEEPAVEAPEVVVDTALLKLKLTAAINAGILASRTRFADKRAGNPKSADPEAITLDDSSQIKWEEIDPKYLFRMYGKCGLKGEDLLVLAEWAHVEGLDAEANKTLSRYLSGKKENRPKVNEIVARWRRVQIPESGYKFNTRLKLWEDASDITHRIAREDAGKLAKKLTMASNTKKIEPLLEGLLAHYNNTELNWETRDEIKALSLDALKQTKKKRIETLEKNTKKTGSFAMLRKLKLELNVRRASAIKLIYDESIYWREDHPQWKSSHQGGDETNGQKQVDELVDAVRDLWESSGKYAAKLSPTVRTDVEIIQKINDEYLAEFGEKAGEDDLKDFDEVMNNLNNIVDLKSFALDAKERRIFEWNRRVEKYNRDLKHEDITSDEKDHFVVLNDYREMMGRKRLFLDPRLCRACKKHSAAQNAVGRIWHVGSDGSPQSRAKAEGFTSGVGENVCLGYATPVATWVRGWYRASDHHRNGLSSMWNCGGYGFVGNVGSQNFANIPTPPDFPK